MSFSLQYLFAFVAVAALGIAAMLGQTRWWTAAFVGVCLTIFVAATVVAIHRRRIGLSVFSGVAWLYVAIVFSSHLHVLSNYLPTSAFLIEAWYLLYGDDVMDAFQIRGLAFSKDDLYQQFILELPSYAGTAGEAISRLANYYVSGHMLCALIVAVLASGCSVYFLKPVKSAE